ncbi:MAG TPA: class IV adenylate cyclase [Chitinophagaceae bacterium]|nr:class IV adenylate cyclase [Chitinophagaceae bacterium]
MPHLNIEVKARCQDQDRIRNYLLGQGAEFRGLDRQVDTYFRVNRGRLKLREGRIENNLIQYERADLEGPKSSHFRLVNVADAHGLKAALTAALGVLVVVDKSREIYYIGNVKFHLDRVEGLGTFVEIEAGNLLADLGAGELRQQCDHYLSAFNVQPADLVSVSYSDLLLDMLGGN